MATDGEEVAEGIRRYLNDYECRTDFGDYRPSAFELSILEDAILGWEIDRERIREEVRRDLADFAQRGSGPVDLG